MTQSSETLKGMDVLATCNTCLKTRVIKSPTSLLSWEQWHLKAVTAIL